MGQGQSINVTPEQMQQLIAETGLERSVLVSLADVFASSSSSKSAPPPATPPTQPKSSFPKLTFRKGSLAPGGATTPSPPPGEPKRKLSMKPQESVSLVEELPLQVFAKLLQVGFLFKKKKKIGRCSYVSCFRTRTSVMVMLQCEWRRFSTRTAVGRFRFESF